MYWSKLFIPTLREEPAGGSAAQRRLIRAGYARSTGYLCLGRRSLDKIAAMVRAEMDLMGGQEVSLEAPFIEAVTSIARHDLRSYKQLPQTWFQIDGTSLQSCSFNLDGVEYRESHRHILDRCGPAYVSLPDEFIVPSADGDQFITHGSRYESNLKHACSVAKPPALPDPEGDRSPEEFHTPGQKTIADICAFAGLPETSQIKSLVLVADGAPVLILLRGDHTLNEHKFRARPATPEQIRQWFGADPGSLGPVGVTNMRILADEALRGRRNMICGANRNDYHLRNVTPGEDFSGEFLDLRMVAEGDTSISDGAPLHFDRAFTLATFDDREADLHVSNESGKEATPSLTHSQLFLDRILIAAAEQQSDPDGLALGAAIAPFRAVITPVNLKDATQDQAARALHSEIADALLDDRDERPGVKFKDADLIGIPFRITVGKKLAQGLVEVLNRRTRQSQDVALDQVAAFLSETIHK
jgi:prolyl-tRNA synthetase